MGVGTPTRMDGAWRSLVAHLFWVSGQEALAYGSARHLAKPARFRFCVRGARCPFFC